MLNINRRKLYIRIMWRDYVKNMQNLEIYAIDFFY